MRRAVAMSQAARDAGQMEGGAGARRAFSNTGALWGGPLWEVSVGLFGFVLLSHQLTQVSV